MGKLSQWYISISFNHLKMLIRSSKQWTSTIKMLDGIYRSSVDLRTFNVKHLHQIVFFLLFGLFFALSLAPLFLCVRRERNQFKKKNKKKSWSFQQLTHKSIFGIKKTNKQNQYFTRRNEENSTNHNKNIKVNLFALRFS